MFLKLRYLPALLLPVLLSSATLHAGSLGLGVHYWKTIDEVRADDLDAENDGYSWVASIQGSLGTLLRAEAALEVLPEEYLGLGDPVYIPQLFLLAGSSLYAGAGIGTHFVDGEFGDTPFYAIRAGIELGLLAAVLLDINANYRFAEIEDLGELDEQVDTDTVTLGASLRISF